MSSRNFKYDVRQEFYVPKDEYEKQFRPAVLERIEGSTSYTEDCIRELGLVVVLLQVIGQNKIRHWQQLTATSLISNLMEEERIFGSIDIVPNRPEAKKIASPSESMKIGSAWIRSSRTTENVPFNAKRLWNVRQYDGLHFAQGIILVRTSK